MFCASRLSPQYGISPRVYWHVYFDGRYCLEQLPPRFGGRWDQYLVQAWPLRDVWVWNHYNVTILPPLIESFNRVCLWVHDLDLLSSTGALMTYHALVCSIGRVPWLRTMDRIYLKLMVDGFVMENLRPEATSALCLFLLAMVETVARDVVSFLHGSLLAIAYLVQPPTMFVVASMPAPRLLWMPPSCMVPMTWTHNIVIGATCWIVLSHMLSRWELHEAEDLLVHGVRCGFVLWH